MSINQKLRSLSLDDLYVLRLLLEGHSLTSAAQFLRLTQPATTQKIKKIETIFSLKVLKKFGRNVKLTQEGMDLCTRAVAALTILESELSGEQPAVINIGTRPEVGRSWIWPAIKALRKKKPHLTFHIHFGSGEEIIRKLGIGELDAIITSAPLTTSHFKAKNLAEEEYIFVGQQELICNIQSFTDLSQYTLIEHDRSFPFLRYLKARDRAKIEVGDVWFLGSSELMVAALEAGQGIGIVPKYLVEKLLKQKKLAKVPLPVSLDSDYFRLIYRIDRDIELAASELAESLIKIGLR